MLVGKGVCFDTGGLDLKPGAYELICNQPGHYHHGMKATFTVTP